jgi:hypothetical protein
VIRSLERVIECRGWPTEHAQLGTPQRDGYIERYNRTVHCVRLARILFDRIEQVQDAATW